MKTISAIILLAFALEAICSPVPVQDGTVERRDWAPIGSGTVASPSPSPQSVGGWAPIGSASPSPSAGSTPGGWEPAVGSPPIALAISGREAAPEPHGRGGLGRVGKTGP
jgi:hypothetical protein